MKKKKPVPNKRIRTCQFCGQLYVASKTTPFNWKYHAYCMPTVVSIWRAGYLQGRKYVNPKSKKEILSKEGLSDWKLKYIKSGGGLTLLDHKEIWIDESYRNSLGMFLHEVTHAIKGKGHDAIWADKFTELVEKYLG